MRLKCIVAYDGTDFAGYQVQPGKRTVQDEIERVLTRMHKQEIKVVASGRTDAGVHAKGQVIHFDSNLQMAEWQWKKGLNALLPDDIHVLHVAPVVANFHARYDAVKKEYRYLLHVNSDPNPFTRNYIVHFPKDLDLATMQMAAAELTGRYDFTSFCATNTRVQDKVREIEKVAITQEDDGVIQFSFVGDGFLYNMVRIIVGTLLEVGTGKRKATEMKEILQAKDRNVAGKTAPAHGLYLWTVWY